MAPSRAPLERQKYWFQFITTPSVDTPGTTLLLHFDNRRYLFGSVAEGLQRACIQRGVSLRKVRNMFLTGSTNWQQMGGLIGMILTMADAQADDKEGGGKGTGQAKRQRIHIHGGPKLMHAMACARRFVFRTGMPLSIHEAKKDEPISAEAAYQDENINVWAIPVMRGRSGIMSPKLSNGRSASPTTVSREQALREKTVTDMFDSDWRKDRLFEFRFDQVKLPAVIWTRDPDTKELRHVRCESMDDAPHLNPESIVMVRNPWPAAMVEELPHADNLSGTVSMSYIVRGQPQRGKFLPQKAQELGVQAGPSRAKLAAGESVTLENGTVITAEMVMTEAEPGRAMAVFDVPSVDYLENLSDQIDSMREKQLLVGLKMVSWLLGPGVYNSSVYHDLVKSLPDLQHVVSSPDVQGNYISFESPAASAIRLSQIRPGCFLAPLYSDEVDARDVQTVNVEPASMTVAQRGMVTQLFPNISIKTSEVPLPFDVADAQISDEVRALIPTTTPDHIPTSFDDIEILALGTGSAVPSKYRNVSATLLRIPGIGSYLFDCGENTLGQLRRLYSPEELDMLLCDLKVIWISHLHADHHLGTMTLITARHQAVERNVSSHDGTNLHVISERNMADYLSDYSSIEPSPGCIFLSVYNSYLQVYNKGPISVQSLPVNIQTLKTTRVSHCNGAQAISVTFTNGFKFSYSGDCRPSSNFAKIGLDSHVLLHEATFEDEKEGDALAKKHSTTAEAIGVATAMRAKNLVLTHFSQRYQKIPVLTNVKFIDQIKFEEGDDAEVDGEPESSNTATADQQTIKSTIKPEQSKNGETSSMVPEAAAATPGMNICVAFDMMRIKYSQIPSMRLYYPAIERMFEVEQEKSDLAREKLAALNEQRTAAKNEKTGSKKGGGAQTTNGSNGGSNGSSSSLYQKINQGKSSKKAKSQDNTQMTNADGEGKTELEPGEQRPDPSSLDQQAPQQQELSKRAQKRKLAAEERKRLREYQQEHQHLLQQQHQQRQQGEDRDVDKEEDDEVSSKKVKVSTDEELSGNG